MACLRLVARGRIRRLGRLLRRLGWLTPLFPLLQRQQDSQQNQRGQPDTAQHKGDGRKRIPRGKREQGEGKTHGRCPPFRLEPAQNSGLPRPLYRLKGENRAHPQPIIPRREFPPPGRFPPPHPRVPLPRSRTHRRSRSSSRRQTRTRWGRYTGSGPVFSPGRASAARPGWWPPPQPPREPRQSTVCYFYYFSFLSPATLYHNIF